MKPVLGSNGKEWEPVQESRQLGEPRYAAPDDYLVWMEELKGIKPALLEGPEDQE